MNALNPAGDAAPGPGGSSTSTSTLKDLFTRAEERYWQENSEVQMMNEMIESSALHYGETSEIFGILSQVENTTLAQVFQQPPERKKEEDAIEKEKMGEWV